MCAFATIHHRKRDQIDSAKWDACIKHAPNGLIYSCSFYLDALCDNWDALIIDDYTAVLPLPWRKKVGIKYLYAPPFIQQLGLTGEYDEGIYEEAIKLVKKNFKYGDLFFNYNNVNLPVPVVIKTNFILMLNKPYSELAKLFSKDLKKNLKAAKEEEFIILSDYPHTTAIEVFQKSYQTRTPHIKTQAYQRFSTLCDQLNKKDNLLIKAIINSKGELLSIALLLKYNNRIYNLMNTTTYTGRKAKANHYLLSEIIKQFSNSNFVFDFEGSDLAGVKEFYENFKPINQPFYHYHFNDLSKLLKLLKK
jgi:hypothetical protein